MGSTDHNSTDGDELARRFGALIAELASKAGYDLTSGQGGRTALARDTGMSASAVGRMIVGKTLPMPHQFESLARAVHADVRTLLVTAGVISGESWPVSSDPHVLSPEAQPLSPEHAADEWGITDPAIRSMLVSTVRNAIRLQNELNGRRGERGEVSGRR